MKKLPFFTLLLMFSLQSLAYTGEVITSIDIPAQFPSGLTFDGENLWFADRKSDKIHCFSINLKQIVKTIEAPAYWSGGLAWDGKNLWCSDIKGGLPLAENYQGKIYKLNPDNGAILHSVLIPSKSPVGLVFDGKYMWCSDYFSDKIVQFDPNDGTTIKEFNAPSGDIRALAYDGKYLWAADRIRDEIYMIDPNTGWVIIIADSPGRFIYGLVFAEQSLWAIDHESKRLFQIKTRDNEIFRVYNPKKYTVMYSHLTTNFGQGTINTLDVHFPIAENLVNQKIYGKATYSMPVTDTVTDQWGQRTAHFHFANIPNGQAIDIVSTTDVMTNDVRFYVYPDKVGKIQDIPADIKAKYLKDDEKYQINHPVIKDAVSKALGNETNAYWIARKLYQYLFDKMYYEMVGGWNTAPAVLERGNGSCSEYTFLYIALCRAAGLPARYVGAVVVRGDESSMDDVFHRWAEVYIPNYGWIPVDASAGDEKSARDQAHYFGWISNRYFITTQSGGDSQTMSWTYNSNEFYTTTPKTFVVTENFAD